MVINQVQYRTVLTRNCRLLMHFAKGLPPVVVGLHVRCCCDTHVPRARQTPDEYVGHVCSDIGFYVHWCAFGVVQFCSDVFHKLCSSNEWRSGYATVACVCPTMSVDCSNGLIDCWAALSACETTRLLSLIKLVNLLRQYFSKFTISVHHCLQYLQSACETVWKFFVTNAVRNLEITL